MAFTMERGEKDVFASPLKQAIQLLIKDVEIKYGYDPKRLYAVLPSEYTYDMDMENCHIGIYDNPCYDVKAIEGYTF